MMMHYLRHRTIQLSPSRRGPMDGMGMGMRGWGVEADRPDGVGGGVMSGFWWG